MKIKHVIQTFREPMQARNMPGFIVVFGAYYTSFISLIAGFFLIAGLFKYAALYLLGIDLLLAGFAFGLIKPMWDMQYVFPRLLMLVFLLLIPESWDHITLDSLICNIK